MGAAPTAAVAWAASGAMALTGRAGEPPLVPPDGVVDRIRGLGSPLAIDPMPLLTERAAAAGLRRRGSTSCGGTARLVPARDGWLGVNLPRDDDLASVPAWLETSAVDDPWEQVCSAAAERPAADLVARAVLLGLPVARLAESAACPVVATKVADGPRLDRPPFVVDLSSLWAGPLCTRLLVARGARVVKVEATARPDGAHRGPPAFSALLNHGKELVTFDLRDPAGRDELRLLITRADVVVEASRRRALQQLGIEAVELLMTGRPAVWASITGYGRDVHRVAFGDDAAVAGGLVADDGRGPCFVADAVADPLAGVAAAAAVATAIDAGGRWMLDVSMAGVAAHVAGDAGAGTWRPGP